MTVHRLLALAIPLAGACSGKGAGDDAAPASDARPIDASMSQATDVSGVLDGQSFRLTFSAVKWPVTGDPRTWVCAANVPVTFAECEASDAPARTMFLGPFVGDAGGADWAIAEVGLFRVGPNPISALAWSGTLSVQDYDPTSGQLRLTLSVEFTDGPTTGTVVVGE